MSIQIKKYLKLIVAASGTLLVILALFIVFQTRAPVLIVSEEVFIDLYGKDRLKSDIFFKSISLFRRIKMVIVANETGDDIVPHAISGVSSSPFCVLFPYRFSNSAKLYKGLFPNIPAVILEGRNSREITEFVIKYKTDIENDFFNAGFAASLIADDGKIAVFIENNIEKQGKEAFLKGLGEEKVSNVFFFSNFSNYKQIPELSCAVIAGTGGEFVEGNAEIPIIFVSWLDPAYFPINVVMVIDDSPLAQLKEAIKLLSAGEKEGLIKSKIHVPNAKIIDKELLRKIQKLR